MFSGVEFEEEEGSTFSSSFFSGVFYIMRDTAEERKIAEEGTRD